MILIDVHRRNLRKHKRARQNQKKLTENESNENGSHDFTNPERKNSFSDQDDILPPVSLLSHQRSFIFDNVIDLKEPDWTIYSGEGMDLPDNLLLEELDLLDNVSLNNKEANCVLASESQQNLTKETEIPSGFYNHRRSHKWSTLFRPSTLQAPHSKSEDVDKVQVEVHPKVLNHEMMPIHMKSSLRKLSEEPKRSCMAIIEEASF